MDELQPLDPVVHQPLRLAVLSILSAVEHAEFTYLKEKTKATAGNLSVQIDKLQQAGYITVKKDFKGKRPCTTCTLTKAGKHALNQYARALKSYLNM